MNGLQPFERTVERTTDTITPSSKTITAAAMTTNRIARLRELLHSLPIKLVTHQGPTHIWRKEPINELEVTLLVNKKSFNLP